LPRSGAEILWDTWGVPHIFAHNAISLFRAFGWAQMENQADLLLRLYGLARGRGAEYWGSQYLQSDNAIHLFSFPQQARVWYRHQSPAFQRYLTAFAEGINAYGRAHPDRIAPELRVVLPVNAEDVIGSTLRTLLATLVQDTGCAGHVPVGSAGASNGWAIGPSHSAAGRAMLLANPHLPWTPDTTTWMEAQLVAPGINAYGAALVGFPVLNIAFNDNLGWTHTTNTLVNCTAYQLTTAAGGYRYDGAVRHFTTWQDTIRVRQPNGALRTQQLLLRRSVQGPVVTAQGQTMAIRIAAVDQFPVYGIYQEWWDMARATNLAQFEAALRRLQIPDQMVIYADRAGHILSLFNGEAPVHSSGSWDYWGNPVPGNTSATLWTKIYPYAALPRVVDPPSGWVQNSNSAPWLTTYPPQRNPANFPPSLAPLSLSMREQRGIHMLRATRRLSYNQMIADLFSSHSDTADLLVPPLVAAARLDGSALGRQAATVLAHWDRSFNATSRGAVLFYAWLLTLYLQAGDQGVFAVPLSGQDPLHTPRGLADPAHAAKVLEQVAAAMQSKGLPVNISVRLGLEQPATGKLPLDVPWGQVFRLRDGHLDLPAAGVIGDPFGVFRVLTYTSGRDGRLSADFGDSFIAAVEFSTPVKAQVLLTYGNFTQPGSPHHGDQLALYARNELRPAWRTRAEIMPHLALRETIG
jgi:acyl-homoserine-lactone acylase